ncbi:MAG: amino acid ABC transporter substrate-binding protein [Chloroflexi bacterium]|nr:MAG: amino acid ABC transporter substrate-binding protein [Chloroflexota bacterium]
MHDNVTDGGNMSMQARPGATNQTASMVRASKAVGALLVAIALTGCASASPSASAPGSAASSPPGDPDAIRIGAVFPLHGNAAGLAAQELRGVQIAAEFANADGGIGGRRVIVDVRDLASRDDAATVMAQLKAEGVGVVVGAYSSDLSMAASEAADEAGLVYWEAGAVADQLTGRGLPMVFRVGASGTNLGSNSASFAARVLTPRLGKASRAALRLAIVAAEDDYARSVADAAAKAAGSAGLDIVTRQSYNLTLPQWPKLMAELVRQLPDVVILASHIPDGIAFRRAMLASGLRVGALIGSTMAECDPDFAGELGPDAVGVFASDRPTGGFQPSALSGAARATYDRFASAWTVGAAPASPKSGYRGDGSGYGSGGGSEYTITGPTEAGTPAAGPTEEGLSGFSATWPLVHEVLPAALARGDLGPAGIATAARGLDLPEGSLPNGAGLRFSTEPATLGQNERAAAVIWQWQAIRSYTFVWPPTYATGSVGFVPLSR